MYRTLAPILLLALIITACGDEDAERKAEAQAVIDSIRTEYEAREANVQSALKTAGEWRNKPDAPPLDWGERPPAKFLDARNNKLDKEANGRIFELGDDGNFNTDPKTMLGLFIEKKWREDIAKAMTGEGYLTKGGVRADFEKFKQVRYLCLLLTDSYVAPKIGTGTLFKVNFEAGHWQGRALYFDLEEGKLIGGKKIEVTNAGNIDFKTKGLEAEEQKKAAQNAADSDLRQKVLEAASNP